MRHVVLSSSPFTSLLALAGAVAIAGCTSDSGTATQDDAGLVGGSTADVGPGGSGGTGGAGGTAGGGGEPGGTVTPADAGPDAPLADAALPDAAPLTSCPEEDELGVTGTAERAVPIEIGFSRDDLYLCPGSQDWFALTLTAGTYVVADLLSEPPETDFDLYLTDAGGGLLASSAGATGAEKLTFTAEADGTFYLHVEGGNSDLEATYALAVTSACRRDADCGAGEICSFLTGACEPEPARVCGADAQEPNNRDDAGFAIDVAAGPVDALICSADPDWYQVALNAGDNLDALLSFAAGEDLDLVVRDLATGALVGIAAGDANSNPERLNLRHLPAGHYAVGVLLFGVEPGDTHEVAYRLDVATAAGRCESDADCGGQNGPLCDATTGTCHPVPDAGRVPVGGQCATSADCLDDGAYCAAAGPGGADNYCTVGCEEDSDCASLGDAAYCARSGGGSLCQRACENDRQCSQFRQCTDGRCRNRPDCTSDEDCGEGAVCTATPFGSLRCALAPEPAQCGFDVNPDGTVRADDTPETAVPLATDGAPLAHQLICVGENDWFRVTVPPEAAGDRLSIEVSFVPTVDIDVYLQDPSGHTIGASTTGDQPVETISLTFVAPGDYFVVVDQYATDSLGDSEYQVRAWIEANEDHCTVEGHECLTTDPLRLVCDPANGACSGLDGQGAVPLSGLCDTDDDCVPGTEACWIYEGPEGAAAGVNICTHTCQGDGDCADIPETVCVDFQQQVAVCLPPR